MAPKIQSTTSAAAEPKVLTGRRGRSSRLGQENATTQPGDIGELPHHQNHQRRVLIGSNLPLTRDAVSSLHGGGKPGSQDLSGGITGLHWQTNQYEAPLNHAGGQGSLLSLN